MTSRSAGETEAYGETLARLLRPGDILWLYGDLGAGKTALARGLARGLGVAERVTSPTYAIANQYTGRMPLTHYDAYRLSGPEELYGAGFDGGGTDGVRAVEWAERAGDGVSGICVMLTVLSENERELALCFLP